jgi:hypothetical protein
MKHAVEMGSGAMTYIPSFIKIGSGFQKSLPSNDRGDTYTQPHRLMGGIYEVCR